jgi:hypothetical protein
MKQIRSKGIKNIVKSVINMIGDDPVHIVFDMAVMSHASCPYITRFLKDTDIDTSILNGLTIGELEELLISLPKKIVGLDIVGFNFESNVSDRAYRITCEIAKMPLKHILNITEKKINIFSEHSKFLIWRPLDQDNALDIGWYILRGTTLDMREEIIKELSSEDNDDKIISFDIDGEHVLVSTTTILEQQEKTYYMASSIYECALMPEEKIDMLFELLNTPQNSLN